MVNQVIWSYVYKTDSLIFKSANGAIIGKSPALKIGEAGGIKSLTLLEC